MPAIRPYNLDALMTVARIVSEYLRHGRAEDTARVASERARVLRMFVNAHGELPLAEAKPYHLRFWVDSHPNWRSNWTKKGVISTVQRAFNWACKMGLIDRNPFAGVTQPEGEPGRALTDKEFAAMLRGSSVPFRRVLVFLRFTGCRPCECAAIEPTDIDAANGVILLKHHKARRMMRVKRPRAIVLHPVAGKLVAYLLRNQVPEQVKLFINSRGTAWTRYAISCRMKRLRKRLGLPADCKTYGCRHAYGTDGIRNGVELKTLSVLMGHADTRTTQRYVHIEADYLHLAKAVRQVIRKG